jgi:hypothetical protein
LIVSGFGPPKLHIVMTHCNRIEGARRQCSAIEVINIRYSSCISTALSISVIQTLNLRRDKNVVSVSTILEHANWSLITVRAIAIAALPRLGSNPKLQRKKEELR